jgi:hypothetical protein
VRLDEPNGLCREIIAVVIGVVAVGSTSKPALLVATFVEMARIADQRSLAPPEVNWAGAVWILFGVDVVTAGVLSVVVFSTCQEAEACVEATVGWSVGHLAKPLVPARDVATAARERTCAIAALTHLCGTRSLTICQPV